MKNRAGGRQNGVGEGNSKIWVLKYKNSEDLGNWRNATTATVSTTNVQRLIKVERE